MTVAAADAESGHGENRLPADFKPSEAIDFLI